MSYIDDRIIEMRKNKSFVKTIKAWVVKQSPLLDCQVCLSRVLTNLDKHNLPYSRREVRKAFLIGYSRDFHRDSTSYINWLCKTKFKRALTTTPNIKEPKNGDSSDKYKESHTSIKKVSEVGI